MPFDCNRDGSSRSRFREHKPDEKADWLAALIGPFNEAILACLDMV